ncbi:diguanylate cyclase [Aquabacterium sp.]|uniref:diguanylate cyclase n=1 Tax=Aquabacterium sp. TaxID=1872578 RepID=UPI003D6CC28B
MSIHTVQHVLMYFLVPLWIAVGFADAMCHRRSDIEHTAGPKESVIHLLMFVEVGIPLLAALFLEINALVIGVMLVAFLVHEATALWDVSYAVSKRVVSPWEQHMHSFLEMIPLMAILLVSLMYQDQFAALFGLGSEAPSFSLRLKADPMPVPYLVILFTAIALFSALPYVTELWRGLKAHRSTPPH